MTAHDQLVSALLSSLLDLAAVRRRLLDSGASLKGNARIVDWWYVPNAVTSHDEHEAWLSSGEACPIRIRLAETSLSRSIVLEAKSPVRADDYSLNVEAAIAIKSVEEGQDFVTALKYHCLSRIEKHRESYAYADTVVVLDDYFDVNLRIVEIERDVYGGPQSDDLRAIAAQLCGAKAFELEASAALTLIRANLLRSKDTEHIR